MNFFHLHDFFKITFFKKNSFRSVKHFGSRSVWPDLDPNCSQRFPEDDTGKELISQPNMNNLSTAVEYLELWP